MQFIITKIYTSKQEAMLYDMQTKFYFYSYNFHCLYSVKSPVYRLALLDSTVDGYAASSSTSLQRSCVNCVKCPCNTFVWSVTL